MALEATIICLDNSEWSRDGDYSPNRWEAQQESANIIAGTQTQLHPENSVGIIAMAGPRTEVLVSPTNDIAELLKAVHSANIKGASDFYTALKISQLALKNRSNKEQKQRIVVFVCSPVAADKEQLAELGRNLKRNNIAIDIVCFGNTQDKEKLEELQKAADTDENSHLVVVPSGFGMLPEMLMNTPIMNRMGGGGPSSFDEYGGIDPSIDPELAQAMRLSMEEAKRQQEEGKEEAPLQDIQERPGGDEEEDEDALLRQAIELSKQEEEAPEKQEDTGFMDSEFVSNILGNLEGVDMANPEIQEMLKKKQEEEKKDS